MFQEKLWDMLRSRNKYKAVHLFLCQKKQVLFKF